MTAPLDDEFDGPGRGDLFANADHEGRLLLITADEYVAEFTTSAGTGPMVRADVVVLDGPDAPVEFENSMLFGKVLTGQLKKASGSGRRSLGRLGLGEKKPGQNAPWTLADPTEDDQALARRYLAKRRAERDSAPF